MSSETVYDGFSILPKEDKELLEEFERVRRKLWLSPDEAVEELYLLEWRIGTRLGELRETLSKTRQQDAGFPAQTEPMGESDGPVLEASTGLFSAAYLREKLPAEVGRAKRRRSTVALLVVDVDRLVCGEPQMRAVAREVLDELRQVCVRIERVPFAVRTSGTEVVAVIPDLDLSGAGALATRIHAHVVERLNAGSPGESDRVTASIGFAALRPDDDAERLFARAKQGLLQAQRAGCNRVAAA
jgi:diguanylate cyclase (GGDEF)-like protein